MDFKQMQYVLKIAETGNITHAANQLYVSQPSLSQYLSKTEDEFGVKLFDRQTSPISLTQAGECYVRAAREIMRLNNNLKEEVADIAEHRRGKITIGIPTSRGTYTLPHVLPAFMARYPGITVEVVEANSDRLRDGLQKGKIDLAILPLLEQPQDVACECLYEEELFLVTKEGLFPDYRPGERNVKSLEGLGDHPFILLKSGHGMRKALDSIFVQYGYQPQVMMEISSNETAYRLASTGIGIAVVPSITMKTVREMQPVDVYALSQAGMKWKVCALYRKGDYLNIVERDLVELLKNMDEISIS